MGCVVLLGSIHVKGHPGAVATPKIQELIRAAEALPQAAHGHVLTALNVEQHPRWHRGTFGIESVYSDILESIYRSCGRSAVDVEARISPRRPIADMPWSVAVFGRAAQVRIRVIRDLPTTFCSLMQGNGVSLPRTIEAEIWTQGDATARDAIRRAMSPLPGGNYMLLAQIFNERKQVLGWSLVPLTVVSPVEITKLDAGTSVFVPHEPLHVVCTVRNWYRAIPTARLETQLEDPRGRILARSSVPLSLVRGETAHDLVLNLAHAEYCGARLQVAVKVDDLVPHPSVGLAKHGKADAAGRLSRWSLRRLL